MANEITAGPSTQSGDIALLFLYKSGLTPRTYIDKDGATKSVIPTPSSVLPAWANDIVSDAEKAALDAGTIGLSVDVLRQVEGMTAADLAVQAKSQYDKMKAAFFAVYAVRYHEFYGARISR